MKLLPRQKCSKLAAYTSHAVQTVPARLIFAFLLPIVSLFLALRIRGLLSGGEFVPFYGLLDSEILGKLHLLSSPDTLSEFFVSLGEHDFAELLSYAVSPINRIIALLPPHRLAFGVTMAMLLRTGLAGFSFSILLGVHKKDSSLTPLLFSTLYALSSHAIMFSYSPSLSATYILFPLVIAGLITLFRNGKPAFFAASLALAAVTNAPALPQLCLLSLIFLTYLLLVRKRGARLLPLILGFLASFGIAFLISLPILHLYFSQLTPVFEGYYFRQDMNILDLFANMLPGVFSGLENQHFPYLFIGMLPILLFPVYFASCKIEKRERIVTASLLLALYFVLSVNSLAHALNLFSAVFPAYSCAYFIVLLFLLIAYRAFCVMDGTPERTILIPGFACAILISLIQKLNLTYTVYLENGTEQKITYFSKHEIAAVWFSLFFLIIYAALLLFVLRGRHGAMSKKGARCLSAALLLFVLFEGFVGASESMKLIEKKVGYPTSASFGSYNDMTNEALSAIPSEELWRVARLDSRTGADDLFYRYPSLSDFSEEQLAAFGITLDENGALLEVASPASLSLLGVRYIIERAPIAHYDEDGELITDADGNLADSTRRTLPYSLSSLFTVMYQSETVTVYENPHALPIVMSAAALTDFAVLPGERTVDAVNRIYASLLGDSGAQVYRPASVVMSPNNAKINNEIVFPGHTVYQNSTETGRYKSSLKYTVTASEDGPLYLSFTTDLARRLTVKWKASLDGDRAFNQSVVLYPEYTNLQDSPVPVPGDGADFAEPALLFLGSSRPAMS